MCLPSGGQCVTNEGSIEVCAMNTHVTISNGINKYNRVKDSGRGGITDGLDPDRDRVNAIDLDWIDVGRAERTYGC